MSRDGLTLIFHINATLVYFTDLHYSLESQLPSWLLGWAILPTDVQLCTNQLSPGMLVRIAGLKNMTTLPLSCAGKHHLCVLSLVSLGRRRPFYTWIKSIKSIFREPVGNFVKNFVKIADLILQCQQCRPQGMARRAPYSPGMLPGSNSHRIMWNSRCQMFSLIFIVQMRHYFVWTTCDSVTDNLFPWEIFAWICLSSPFFCFRPKSGIHEIQVAAERWSVRIEGNDKLLKKENLEVKVRCHGIRQN